jgi:hypothetical protein
VKVFKNEAEKLVIVMPTAIAGAAIGHFFFGGRSMSQVDWATLLITNTLSLLPFIILTPIMDKRPHQTV